MILEIFTMFDTAKVEIKKEHQSLVVSETTSFKKGKGNKGYFMKRQISCCTQPFCSQAQGLVWVG